ncbi:hypothetical protein RUM43_004028 [Polyplax serrata]|uniref:Uncharacterized protein n=1 Tax=Polyplax serrata TaxID=468196 RepID=A0AAN8SAY0_POLSC
MRIAILFLTGLIVVNTVYCTRKSKASTSKGRGGNSRINRADTQLQKPKTGDGIGLSRKKRSVPPDVPFSEEPKSKDGKSQASTSKGHGGNSRVKRGAIDREVQKPKSGGGIGLSRKKRSVRPEEPFSELPKSTDDKSQPSTSKGRGGNSRTRSKARTSKGRGGNSRIKRGTTELQKPKSGAGIRVSRKKRSAPAGEALSDVPESTHGKSKASTSKGRGGNSRVKRGAIRPATIDRELQKPKSGAGIPVRRKKRSVPQDEPFSDVAQTSDGSNTQKENNGKTDNKGKIKPLIKISRNIKIRDTTN